MAVVISLILISVIYASLASTRSNGGDSRNRQVESGTMARNRFSGFVLDIPGKRYQRFIDAEASASRYNGDAGDKALTSWQDLDNSVVIDSSWCTWTNAGKLSVVFSPEGNAQAGFYLRVKVAGRMQVMTVIPIPGTVRLRRY